MNNQSDLSEKTSDGKRTLRGIVYSNPIRAVLCILYLLAAYIVMSRYGLLPRIVSFPLDDGSIAVSSIFYYTGNSFNNLVQNADEERIPAGIIDKLDLFSTSNYDGGGYYDPEKDSFYFNRSNYIYSFRAPKEKGRKELEYIDTKSIDGNHTLDYEYAVHLGDLYFHLGRGSSVLADAKGTHSLYGKSFTENENTIEEVGEILLKNKTEKITFHELLKVLYFYSNDKLIYWDTDSARLVWFIREQSGGDQLHFAVYDPVNDIRQDYDSSAGIELSDLLFFPWDESHFVACSKNTCELYQWDFVNNTTEYITKLPSSQHYTFRILDDGTLVAALVEYGTNEVWFYRQSTDTLSKLSGDTAENLQESSAIVIGKDTVAVFKPFECKYYSFEEAG